MKDVYYLVATKNGNKISYEVVETKIPMLFIQKDAVSDFGSEAKEMNKSVFTQQPTLPVSKLEIASEYIEKNVNTLKTLKEQLAVLKQYSLAAQEISYKLLSNAELTALSAEPE